MNEFIRKMCFYRRSEVAFEELKRCLCVKGIDKEFLRLAIYEEFGFGDVWFNRNVKRLK